MELRSDGIHSYCCSCDVISVVKSRVMGMGYSFITQEADKKCIQKFSLKA
jgi:hypothetical protein